MSEVSLVRGYCQGILAEGLFELFDGSVVGGHGGSGHDRHFVRFDAELTSYSIKLMDCDAHDAGCGVDSWSLRERVGKTNRIELTKM